MLVVGKITAQRQWFTDPLKAVNLRFLATQFYDENLKQLHQALLSPTDSRKFEQAIAALLFVLGFAPAVQVETNAPDLIVASPSGQLIVAECTTKIADFHSKLGKLIDRRRALARTLTNAQHNGRVHAFLVCALPRDQIAATQRELIQNQIVLVCREQIEAALLQVNAPGNADVMLENLLRSAWEENA